MNHLTKLMIIAVLSLPAVGKCAGVEICYSQETKGGNTELTADQTLSCPQLGKTNLIALNKDGWSVVNVIYVGNIDPHHRPWMVVLQQK